MPQLSDDARLALITRIEADLAEGEALCAEGRAAGHPPPPELLAQLTTLRLALHVLTGGALLEN